MTSHKYWTCRPNVKVKDMMEITPNMLVLFAAFVNYAETRNLPVVVTSIKNDSRGLKRVSSTHQTGRAIDISLKGWSKEEINKARAYFNTSYNGIGAISKLTGRPTPFYDHGDKGSTGYHLHLQVRP